MPELPEVEAVCRNVRRDALGARVVQFRVTRPNVVRPQDPAQVEAAIEGARLEGVDRKGKNILLQFSGGMVLHTHLRMTGNLYVIPDVRFRVATARAWFELEGGRGLIFDDPRNLGRMRLYANGEAFEDIGIEPLSPEFTAEWLAARAAKSRKPAKLFLMDQAHIAGLGNIYAAEALYRAAIDPRKAIGRVRRPKLDALHAAIVAVLSEAVDSAGLAYSKPGVFNEAEEFDCAVYDREGEPCRRCGRKIKRFPQGGRSTYFCAGCQR